MKYLSKINLLVFFLLLYMFTNNVVTILMTNQSAGPITYYKLVPKDSNPRIQADTKLNEYLMETINQYKITLIGNNNYIYSTDSKIKNQYLALVKRSVENPILIDSETYYVNNYSDVYHFEGEDYSIGGLYSQTIIPMQYLSSDKLMSIIDLSLYGEREQVDQIVTDLNDNGFDVKAEQATYSVHSGTYDTDLITVITSFIKRNLALVVILVLALIVTEISLKERKRTLDCILNNYGYQKRHVFKYYIINGAKNTVVVLMLLFILLLGLELLHEHYLFLSGIQFNKLSFIIICLIALGSVILTTLFRVLIYRLKVRRDV